MFPSFLALNSGGGVGSGYLPAVYAPFRVTPATGGIGFTTNPDGQTTFNTRWSLMHSLDDSLRIDSPNGGAMDDYNDFYSAAQGMMYNPVVNTAFAYTSADSLRYGSSGTGNACLVAAQVLKQNQGTRFIQITSNDGWDMHQNIYAATALPAKAKILDTAVATLISDLKANGQFDETMIVMAGEFGRTVGALTPAAGRDHYPQQFAFFAGGGIKGGTIIGQSNSDGSGVVELRLVAKPLRLSRRYRSDGLLRHGNRLDHCPARRPARPRFRVRAADRIVSFLPGTRTLGIVHRVHRVLRAARTVRFFPPRAGIPRFPAIDYSLHRIVRNGRVLYAKK